MKVGDRVCLKHYKDKRGTITYVSPSNLYTIEWDHGSVSILDQSFILKVDV
jgi:hypothetical protein